MLNSPEVRLRRSWPQRLIVLMNMVLIGMALGTAALLNYGFDRVSDINRVALDRSLTPVPADADRGERVLNVLLVGSDSSSTLDPDDPVQIGRQGEQFGDVIIIAHLDERTGEVALLSLPRDLWVPIVGAGRDGRVNKAFELGGPAMLIDTIETEFGIPIHHYVNVDFAGFQGLVEAVGSVDVYFETPARDWNTRAVPVPRSQTGFVVETAGCQALDPVMALAYVRSRYYQTKNDKGDWVTDPSADLGRIRRQQDFIRRLVQRAIDVGARNPFVLNDLVDAGLRNVAIDQALTPQLLLDIGAVYRSFDPDELQTFSLPVKDAEVGSEQVLLPVRSAAEPVLAVFRGASLQHPSTIELTVAAEESDTTAERLSDVGFILDHVAAPRSDGSETIVIQHGPDGTQAAELVAAAMKSEGLHAERTIKIDLVRFLPARTVNLIVPSLDPASPKIQAAEQPIAGQNKETQPNTSNTTTSSTGIASTTTIGSQPTSTQLSSARSSAVQSSTTTLGEPKRPSETAPQTTEDPNAC